MALRGHEAIRIDDFMGYWARGGEDEVPPDHFSACENLQTEYRAFRTRDGIEPFIPFSNVVRMYTYIMQDGHSLIALDVGGNFYHDRSPTPYTPILSLPGCTDFSMLSIAGRAYITPNQTLTDAQGNQYLVGMQNQSVYVYKGTGVAARKAGGAPPVGASFAASNSATAGSVETGVHVFAVVYETDTGYLTAPGPAIFATVTAPGGKKVSLTGIPTSPDTFVVARWIIATKRITNYNGDQDGYQFFFIPSSRIGDNVTTTATVDFFDVDLLEDASHLIDNYTNIPAGVGICLYHNRMVTFGEYDNKSVARVSAVGEPEAVNQIDGLLIVPLDGIAISNGQEYRDNLYLFKPTRTFSYVDNGDTPANWPLTIVDNGCGASPHGLALVLDSGGVNIEYLIVVDYSGVMLFNGIFSRPNNELTWKIKDFWLDLDRSSFLNIQIMNDTINQRLYLTLPDRKMLMGDYALNLTAKEIKWIPWRFDISTNTIALYNTDTLLIGSAEAL